MKKAKIVLSAVALFAVVGGAFAFKATRIANTFYTTGAAGLCTTTTTLKFTTVNNGRPVQAVAGIHTTAVPDGPCPGLNVYPVE